jgi:hypothetical protein
LLEQAEVPQAGAPQPAESLPALLPVEAVDAEVSVDVVGVLVEEFAAAPGLLPL